MRGGGLALPGVCQDLTELVAPQIIGTPFVLPASAGSHYRQVSGRGVVEGFFARFTTSAQSLGFGDLGPLGNFGR